MSAFFAMGGYAAFVWPAWGLSALAMIAAAALSMRAHARARAKAKALGLEGEDA